MKMLRPFLMYRITALLVCFMLMLSLGLGSVAHATEGASCVETTAGTSVGHSDGDGDQVPGDADNAFSHHHGGCHGHHIGIPIAENPALPVTATGVALLSWIDSSQSLAASDADLRPPKA